MEALLPSRFRCFSMFVFLRKSVAGKEKKRKHRKKKKTFKGEEGESKYDTSGIVGEIATSGEDIDELSMEKAKQQQNRSGTSPSKKPVLFYFYRLQKQKILRSVKQGLYTALVPLKEPPPSTMPSPAFHRQNSEHLKGPHSFIVFFFFFTIFF